LLFGAAFYSYQVDIWSLGCVIFEMITNRALFEGSNSTSMIFKIIKTIGSPSKSDVVSMKLNPEEMEIS
jgi:serine/threonine protein kinase